MSDQYEIRLDQDNLPTGRNLASDAELVSYLKNRGVLVPVEPTELYYIDRSNPDEKGWAYAHIDRNGERAYTEGFGVLTELGEPA